MPFACLTGGRATRRRSVKENIVEEVRRRLESELGRVMERLGQTRARKPSAGPPDYDVTPGNGGDEDREMSFATRSLLVGKAKKVLEALERLRNGEYGICQECGEAISPRRLTVIPEASTCVRCQDRLDRVARRLETVLAGAGEGRESFEVFSSAG